MYMYKKSGSCTETDQRKDISKLSPVACRKLSPARRPVRPGTGGLHPLLESLKASGLQKLQVGAETK